MTYVMVSDQWGRWRVAATFSADRPPAPQQVDRDYPNAHDWAIVVESLTPEEAVVVAERTSQRGERVYMGVAYVGRVTAWRFGEGAVRIAGQP